MNEFVSKFGLEVDEVLNNQTIWHIVGVVKL